jgi:manganese transport protein
MAFFGPAYLVSVGYMDPGNWATDLAGGSQFGYTLIWVLLCSNIIALFLQSLCTRLGIVRGQDLAQCNRETYPKGMNFILYLLAEIAIAACDLAEILGMAIGLQLLFGLDLIWGVLISSEIPSCCCICKGWVSAKWNCLSSVPYSSLACAS